MATTVDSNIAQSSSQQLSIIKSSSSSSASARKDEVKNSALNVSAVVAKDNNPGPVDTVKISTQAIQSNSDVKKDEAKKVEAKKDAAGSGSINVSTEGATAKVQFVYNQKGDMITKYLDSSGELIYQVPSKLMLLTEEAAESKSKSSIDTRV